MNEDKPAEAVTPQQDEYPLAKPAPTVPMKTLIIPEQIHSNAFPDPTGTRPHDNPNVTRLGPKKVFHDDKRGGKLTSPARIESGKKPVTKTDYPDEILVEAWECKEQLLTEEYDGDDKSVEVVLSILEAISDGGRWAKVLETHNLSWARYWTKYMVRRPRAILVQKAAERLGNMARDNRMEDEAWRRAVEGYQEEVYTQSGKFAGFRTKYSDALLALVLRARNPKKYGHPGAMPTAASGVVLQVNLGIERDPVIEVAPAKSEEADNDK